MPSEPRCSLCSGELVKEKSVVIALGGVFAYTQAWVCTHCSAAFPIAVGQKTFASEFEPLYADGNRLRDRSS